MCDNFTDWCITEPDDEEDIVTSVMSAIDYEGTDSSDAVSACSFKEYLVQALTRPSYAFKYGIPYNSEVLEFYGDSLLNAVVSMEMAKHYKKEPNYSSPDYVDSDGWMYNSKYTEAELTKIRSSLVCKDNLAKRMDELSLSHYIYCEDGDLDENGYPKKSVKEDTFEAIIGAVAMDCEFDMEAIHDVVVRMLNLEAFFNEDVTFIDYQEEVNKYYKQVNGDLPQIVVNVSGTEYKASCDYYDCYGSSKREARKNLYKEIYYSLKSRNAFISLECMVGSFTTERAVNQVKELEDKGIFSSKYEFTSQKIDNDEMWQCTLTLTYDENKLKKTGSTPIWKTVVEKSDFEGSKKFSKKVAAMDAIEAFDRLYVKLMKEANNG